MNRVDRMLAIVLHLQARGQMRAEDLAGTFEVSKRTIYRDILALDEAGVPIVSMPGQGYSLAEGYFLPPLGFSADEATMLLLGSDFVARSFNDVYRAVAQSAGRKIEAVLPEQRRAKVWELLGGLRFVGGALERPAEAERLRNLRRAILEQRTVRFEYHARFSGEPGSGGQVRQANPYGLAHVAGAWCLIAYCHLRCDIRRFRLARMEKLALLRETFSRPPDFRLDRAGREQERTITVRAVFAPEIARWVQESPSFYTVREEAHPDGLLVTLQVRQEREVLQWLLSWGSRVRVLEPESLRQQLAEHGEALWRHHRREPPSEESSEAR